MTADPIQAVIVDSGGANLASLQFALERLGARSVVSTDGEVIRHAPRVLLPGVGSAQDAMARLRRAAYGFVFQAFHILPHLSLAQNVALLTLHSFGSVFLFDTA